MVSGVWTNCKLITFPYDLVLVSTFVPYEAKNAKQSQFYEGVNYAKLVITMIYEGLAVGGDEKTKPIKAKNRPLAGNPKQ